MFRKAARSMIKYFRPNLLHRGLTSSGKSSKLEKDAFLAHNLGIEAAKYALSRGAKDIIDKLPKEKRLH